MGCGACKGPAENAVIGAKKLSLKVKSAEVVPHEDEDESGSDNETQQVRPDFLRKRALATCVEVFGAVNHRKPHHNINYEKTSVQKRTVKTAIRHCRPFLNLKREDIVTLVDATQVITVQKDECILKAGDWDDALFVVLQGAIDIFEGEKILFQDNEPLKTIAKGEVFGEDSMLFNARVTQSAYGNSGGVSKVGRLDRSFFLSLMVRHAMKQRVQRQELLKGSKLLETLKDEQIAKLAETLELRVYEEGEPIITQGQIGHEFYVMQSGEAVVEVESGWFAADVQEHRRYFKGDLFGERAILSGQRRAASVIACSEVEVLVLSRRRFERMLGPITQLQADLYLSDPRKIIADFYTPGDHHGPGGALKLRGLASSGWCATSWFAVYRPTSRDAIAKMLAGVAVGKGLNIKGKSAKKGVLSGCVPFIQISENKHKDKVEPPEDVRLRIFYKTKELRELVKKNMHKLMQPDGPDGGLEPSLKHLGEPGKCITFVDDWANLGTFSVFGLEMPEALMQKVYVQDADLTPLDGWETGRASEPAFFNMNLHAIRGNSEPKIVILQHDTDDPMNPLGLLVAYAEEFVKPVVSDFDTFTIGSKNMLYSTIPAEQAEIVNWSLQMAEEVLSTPGDDGWNSRWLRVLERENAKGFHPEFPKYGFGDAISYGLIDLVVQATLSCGAIRHGAECFNFYFPQELDDEYLVVWEHFPELPWAYKSEAQLRQFLLDRVAEGYSFPLNPVWPIRDKGWYAVLEALRQRDQKKTVMKAWTTSWVPDAEVLEKIERIHERYPDGFQTLKTIQANEKMRKTYIDPSNGRRTIDITETLQPGTDSVILSATRKSEHDPQKQDAILRKSSEQRPSIEQKHATFADPSPASDTDVGISKSSSPSPSPSNSTVT